MRGQTELLRVRRQSVAVDLALAAAAPRRVELFLPEPPAGKDRRQQVLDLIEEGPDFLPARESASGRWEIFHRNAVLWVRILPGSFGPEAEESDELFDFRQKVRVDLDAGDPLEGELLYSAQEQETRVTDYMNYESRFFRLWRGEDLYLINKSHVIRVLED